MNFAVFLAAVTVAAAAPSAPQVGYSNPEPPLPQIYIQPSASTREASGDVVEVVPILKDDRVHEEDGSYSVDVETGNGIALVMSGSPDGPEGAVVTSGQYSYTAPDGSEVLVKFVADGNGYQPESDLLPVAPAFPHEIPQFVLDQIAKAAEEDAAAVRAAESAPRAASYSVPEPQQPQPSQQYSFAQ